MYFQSNNNLSGINKYLIPSGSQFNQQNVSNNTFTNNSVSTSFIGNQKLNQSNFLAN